MDTTRTARPRTTKKYKALIAAGLSDTDALTTMGVEVPAPAAEVDPRVTTLLDGGFTQEQAERIVAEQDAPKKDEGKI